ncbi:MAG: hypothetical protein JXA11_13410 [Phycisphaerae bacterium]|nr:hypothetical protein [Phycisphaerae bacterium]
MSEARWRYLVRRSRETFGLDLRGMTVATEVGSGVFLLTPLIAAQAGAENVFALCRDTRYGSAADITRELIALAKSWGLAGKIEIVIDRETNEWTRADIVTNLGNVRPLDAATAERLGPKTVVPLMCESWEVRQADADIAALRAKGIPTAGTDEQHPDLRTMDYLGTLAGKLLLEMHVEWFRSRVMVIGGGKFGRAVERGLQAGGADVTRFDTSAGADVLTDATADIALNTCDAVVVCEHQWRGPLIGPDGPITAEQLAACTNRPVVAHICGNVAAETLPKADIPYRPEHLAPAGTMSLTTAYLGPRPMIDLHTAGLKVGEELARAVREGYSGGDAEARAAGRCRLVEND